MMKKKFLLDQVIRFGVLGSLLIGSCQKDVLKSAETKSNISVLQSETTNLSATSDEFTIIVMPDTQHYMTGKFGATVGMFNSQINWIINQKDNLNIKYVLGLGDIVHNGDEDLSQWVKASKYYDLETAGIPYGLSVGNHEQTENGHAVSGTTNYYNQYFGITHFANKSYYGGHYGNNNDNHYDFFSAVGINFVVVHLEYDGENEDRVNRNNWADSILTAYPNHKAIVVTHSMLQPGEQADFTAQGQAIYNKLKSHPNLFLMLGGHLFDQDGEGYREDVYNGNTVRTMLTDYQGRGLGGNGLLRIVKVRPNSDDVAYKTYSPYTDEYEKDVNSQFTKPLFGPPPAAIIANGKYKITVKSTGKVAGVKSSSLDNLAEITQANWANNPNQKWNFTQVGTSGYYKVINENSGYAMKVDGASVDAGAAIVQSPYSGNDNYNDEWGIISLGNGYYKMVSRHCGLCLTANGTTSGSPLTQSAFENHDAEIFQITAVQ